MSAHSYIAQGGGYKPMGKAFQSATAAEVGDNFRGEYQ